MSFADSGSLEAGSGPISFGVPLPPQDYFSAFCGHSWTQVPSEFKFTRAQFRNCLASLSPKSKPWERSLMGEFVSLSMFLSNQFMTEGLQHSIN